MAIMNRICRLVFSLVICVLLVELLLVCEGAHEFSKSHKIVNQEKTDPTLSAVSKIEVNKHPGSASILRSQNQGIKDASASVLSNIFSTYSPEPVALGAIDQSQITTESQANYRLHSANPSPQSMMINSNSGFLSGPMNGMVIQPSSALNQQSMEMSQSAGQVSSPGPQVLASLYIDQFGNQQLRMPNQLRPVLQQSSIQPVGSQNRQTYAKESAKNFFDTQQQRTPLNGLYYSEPDVMPNQYDQSQLVAVDMQQSNQGPMFQQHPDTSAHQVPQLASSMAFPPTVEQVDQSKDSKTVSNEQLLALIDELKQFNSRQGPVATGDEGQEDETDAQDDEDNETDTSSVATKHTPNESRKPVDSVKTNVKSLMTKKKKKGAKRAGENEKHDTKANTDELARFAKFLLTKEGANMRFQLGLEKDSPDDGDDEERDTLLESKTKKRKAKVKNGIKPNGANELNELDLKHTQVADQMDKLLESLSGALGQVEKRQKKDKKRTKHQNKDEDLKARARRNSAVSSSPKATSKTSTRIIIDKAPIMEEDEYSMEGLEIPKYEPGHKDNYAKKLIRQELREDKEESQRKAQQVQEDSHYSDKDPLEEHKQNSKSVKPKGKNRRETGVEIIELNGGYTNEHYPTKDRHEDRSALLQELEKTRRSKAASRSSDIVHNHPIVRKALGGEMAIQSELRPDGSLTLKSGHKGGSISLKLPRPETKNAPAKGLIASESDEASKEQPVNNSGALESVKLESKHPVKDEYPVSERVSSRLNELSLNLDRYFNDGFLREVKSQSTPREHARDDPQQADASNEQKFEPSKQGDKGTRKATNNQTEANSNGDKDFDVNVGIDGKRDDSDSDDDYEADDYDNEKERIKGSKEQATMADGQRIAKKKLAKTDRSNSPNRIRKGPKERPIRAKATNHEDGELVHGSVKQDMSAANEHLTFESRVNPTDERRVLDPVDGESFDTPIGPDAGFTGNKIPATAKKNVESSSESRKVASKFGKKTPNKFFEEPEW